MSMSSDEQWAKFREHNSKYLTHGPDKNGDTALHAAAEGGYEHVAQDLIKQGHDINAKNNFGDSVMDKAIAPIRYPQSDMRAIQQSLIDAGADLQVKNKASQGLLHIAAGRGDGEMCKYLVNRGGIDVNVKDNRGYTPLHFTAQLSGGAVDDLLALGADPSIKGTDNLTPRDIAVANSTKSALDDHEVEKRLQARMQDLQIPDIKKALANALVNNAGRPDMSVKARKL